MSVGKLLHVERLGISPFEKQKLGEQSHLFATTLNVGRLGQVLLNVGVELIIWGGGAHHSSIPLHLFKFSVNFMIYFISIVLPYSVNIRLQR